MLNGSYTMTAYELSIEVEELRDGSDYRFVATSPDLPSLVVAGDTTEEVLSLAPQVAAALIASLRAAGDPLPPGIRHLDAPPFVTHVTAPA
jgi:predicted RNase H-like HicB family nuclease